MVVPLDRERLLAAVERSPQAAAAHDRTGWVGLFTGDARVQDPVGSRPHVGHEQIGRFYDTFIGPRDIKFHRDLDIVFGTAVLRDLELEVAMGPAVTMYIPALLRYDLREANGDWLIGRLRAYWELPAMMAQFLRAGPGAVSPALHLSKGLLTNQAWRGPPDSWPDSGAWVRATNGWCAVCGGRRARRHVRRGADAVTKGHNNFG